MSDDSHIGTSQQVGHKEIGYFPLELTEEGRDSVLGVLSNVPVLHWHGDQFLHQWLKQTALLP